MQDDRVTKHLWEFGGGKTMMLSTFPKDLKVALRKEKLESLRSHCLKGIVSLSFMEYGSKFTQPSTSNFICTKRVLISRVIGCFPLFIFAMDLSRA